MPKKQIRARRVAMVLGIAAISFFVSGIYFFFSWNTLYLWVVSALLLFSCKFFLKSRWICPYCRNSLRKSKVSINLYVKRCPHCNYKLGQRQNNETKLGYFEAQELLKKEKRVQLQQQRKYKRRQEQREHIKMLRKKKEYAKFKKKVHLLRQKKHQEKYIREIKKRRMRKQLQRKKEKVAQLRKHEQQHRRIRSERQKFEKKRRLIAKRNAQRMDKKLQDHKTGVSESSKKNVNNFREKILLSLNTSKNKVRVRIAQFKSQFASVQKRLVINKRVTGVHVAQKHYNVRVILRKVTPFFIAVITLASAVLLTGIYHSMAIEQQDSSTSTNIQMQSMASKVEAIHLAAEAIACNQAKRIQNVAAVLQQKDAEEVLVQESENVHKPEVQQTDETETQQSTQAIQSEQKTQVERANLGQYKLTFYCPCEICNGEFETQTTSGVPPKEGKTIAVDASIIPMGSEIYIDGFGTYYAEDTGGAIKGNRIDIFVDTHEKALEMGEKYADVYIVQ